MPAQTGVIFWYTYFCCLPVIHTLRGKGIQILGSNGAVSRLSRVAAVCLCVFTKGGGLWQAAPQGMGLEPRTTPQPPPPLPTVPPPQPAPTHTHTLSVLC